MRSANGERNRPGGAILVTRPEGLRALDVRRYMTGVRARRTKNLAKGRASDKFLEKEEINETESLVGPPILAAAVLSGGSYRSSPFIVLG